MVDSSSEMGWFLGGKITKWGSETSRILRMRVEKVDSVDIASDLDMKKTWKTRRLQTFSQFSKSEEQIPVSSRRERHVGNSACRDVISPRRLLSFAVRVWGKWVSWVWSVRRARDNRILVDDLRENQSEEMWLQSFTRVSRSIGVDFIWEISWNIRSETISPTGDSRRESEKMKLPPCKRKREIASSLSWTSTILFYSTMTMKTEQDNRPTWEFDDRKLFSRKNGKYSDDRSPQVSGSS